MESSKTTGVELALFRQLLIKECGLYFAPSRDKFLINRIEEEMRRLQVLQMWDYYKRLCESPEDLATLINKITILETSFFRNPPHFNALKQQIISTLVQEKRNQGGRSIWVWSAGCATGEEPYSLAMLLREHPSIPSSWRFRVVGTDINREALLKAREGVYMASDLKSLDPLLQKRYFEPKGEQVRVRDWIRKMVEFRYLNLVKERMNILYDIIFCQNVLFYFEESTRKIVYTTLEQALHPGGYLLVGQSEMLTSTPPSLKVEQYGEAMVYRRLS